LRHACAVQRHVERALQSLLPIPVRLAMPDEIQPSLHAARHYKRPLIGTGMPATRSTTRFATRATCWFSSPSRSRYRRPLLNAGTTPLPTSFDTRNTDACVVSIAVTTDARWRRCARERPLRETRLPQ